MRIGELAARTGLSRDTLRFYERSGLLVGITRPNPANSYKDYAEANVQRLAVVACLKPLGFTLAECREILSVAMTDKGRRRVYAARKLAEVEERIRELEAARDHLREVLRVSASPSSSS
ncbi:MAG: MerR family transcriptional regulator [Myxococcota bacterium]